MNTKEYQAVLTKEIKKMKKLEEEIVEKNKGLSGEKLRCAKKGKSFQYYIGNEYIPQSRMQQIREIANREYREQLLSVVREKIKVLGRLREQYRYDFTKPESVYANLHPARKCLVEPLIIPMEDYAEKWQAEPYEHWEISDEDVKGTYITARGERVRSKSEKIIADSLHRHGIPYKYEYPLTLKDGRRTVMRRPDFLVLSLSSCEEKIIEHLGLMDREDYYLKNLEKIDLYERNGYLIGKKLILFHETTENPLNTDVMERYISEFLL